MDCLASHIKHPVGLTVWIAVVFMLMAAANLWGASL